MPRIPSLTDGLIMGLALGSWLLCYTCWQHLGSILKGQSSVPKSISQKEKKSTPTSSMEVRMVSSHISYQYRKLVPTLNILQLNSCDSPCWVDPITSGSVLTAPGRLVFFLGLLPEGGPAAVPARPAAASHRSPILTLVLPTPLPGSQTVFSVHVSLVLSAGAKKKKGGGFVWKFHSLFLFPLHTFLKTISTQGMLSMSQLQKYSLLDKEGVGSQRKHHSYWKQCFVSSPWAWGSRLGNSYLEFNKSSFG